MSRGAAGWDVPYEAGQVPALQGCGTMARLTKMLSCSPSCCVQSPPGWHWSMVPHGQPLPEGHLLLQRGCMSPSRGCGAPGT